MLQALAIMFCYNGVFFVFFFIFRSLPHLDSRDRSGKYMVVSSSCRCCSTVDLDTEICSSFDTTGTTLEKIKDMVFSISLDVPNVADSERCCAALSDDVKYALVDSVGQVSSRV